MIQIPGCSAVSQVRSHSRGEVLGSWCELQFIKSSVKDVGLDAYQVNLVIGSVSLSPFKNGICFIC